MSKNSIEAVAETPARAFVPILSTLRHGEVVHELAEELQRLVSAVKDTAKAGKLTLTISVNKIKGNERGIMIEALVVSRCPVLPKGADVFFSDETNGLHRSDPNQGQLFGQPRLARGGAAESDAEAKTA